MAMKFIFRGGAVILHLAPGLIFIFSIFRFITPYFRAIYFPCLFYIYDVEVMLVTGAFSVRI